jgi:hypothetical protein
MSALWHYPVALVATSLAACWEPADKKTRECGNRTPVHREAQAAIVDIDKLAKILPDGSSDRVVPVQPLHSTR